MAIFLNTFDSVQESYTCNSVTKAANEKKGFIVTFGSFE